MRRRWVRFGLAVILAWVIFLGVCFWYRDRQFRRGDEAIAAAIAEIETADPHWRWDDIEAARKPVPDERNMADMARKFGLDAEIEAAAPEWKSVWELESALPDHPVNELPPGRWLRELEALRPGIEPAYGMAREMARRGELWVPYDLPDNVVSLLLPHIQGVRSATGLLRIEALRLAASGRGGETLSLIDDALILAESLRDEPILISQLVRVAVHSVAIGMLEQTLAQGELPGSEAELLALSARLAEVNRRPVLLPAFRGERASLHQLFRNIETGKVNLSALNGLGPGGAGTWGGRVSDFVEAPDVRFEHATVLRGLTEVIAILNEPRHEWEAAVAELPPLPTDREYILAGALLPGVEQIIDAELRTHARIACARVAIACEIYRQRHGHWPESIKGIPTEMLPDPPVNPYTGEALNMASRPEGLVVHTGGTLPKAIMIAPRPREFHGFRLWNPELRGVESSIDWVRESDREGDVPGVPK